MSCAQRASSRLLAACLLLAPAHVPALLLPASRGLLAPTRRPCAAAPVALFGFGQPSENEKRLPGGYAEASHILIRSADEEQDDQDAQALKERIERGELSFGEAATKFSSCPSRGKLGDLGTFNSLSRILFLPYEGQSADVRGPQSGTRGGPGTAHLPGRWRRLMRSSSLQARSWIGSTR